jgi:hypothetical protein
MKRIYAEIGNGGFGPCYALIGWTDGVPDDIERQGLIFIDSFEKTRMIRIGRGHAGSCRFVVGDARSYRAWIAQI